MMLPTPRIIAIDDNLRHLEVLVKGLNQCGTACLPIHFEGETESIMPCSHVRVIFADLNLISGSLNSEDHATHFSLIGSLIKKIEPSGPYFIILWTRFADQANNLHDYLMTRLDQTVTKPFTVKALDKSEYLDLTQDDVRKRSLKPLVQAIREYVADQPQFVALSQDQTEELQSFLDRLENVAKLLTIEALNRRQYPDQTHDNVKKKSLEPLVQAIKDCVAGQPHFEAVYPDKAAELQNLLDRLESVAKRFTIQALDKSQYLGQPQDDLRERSLEPLVQAIKDCVADQPQFGALLNWEECVLSGAADTLSSITEMASSVPDRPGEELGRLLRILAEGAVGKDHVEDDRFRAVNDALLPILADQLASMRSQGSDDKLWKDALKEEGEVSTEKAAKLNSFLHIAPLANSGNERGAVIALPEEFLDNSSPETLDSCPKEKDMFEKQFSSKPFHRNECSRWVLVQTQASCDYAQNQPGLLPFYLGLLIPKSSVKGNRKPPAALWRSPCFEYEQQVQYLHVSARFPVSFLKERASQASPLFRLREQLLNDLIYHLHSYGARPGIISFRS